jgi:diguanylate cyclase (GGDEF)-like protein
MIFNLDHSQEQHRKESKQAPHLHFAMTANWIALAGASINFHKSIFTILISTFALLFVCSKSFCWLSSIRNTAFGNLLGDTIIFCVAVSIFLCITSGLWAIGSYFSPDFSSEIQSWYCIGVTIAISIFSAMAFTPKVFLSIAIINSIFLLVAFQNGDLASRIIYADSCLAIFLLYAIAIKHNDMSRKLKIAENILKNQSKEARALCIENNFAINYDSLTSLPNRTNFFCKVKERVIATKNKGGYFSLGTIDLDDFKAVNDIYGHVVGDQLLSAVGRRLAILNKDNVLIGRLGGDEFGFLLSEIHHEKQLLAHGETIANLVSEPYQLGVICVRITASIGMASYQDTLSEPCLLFEQANFAMLSSKKKGRGLVSLFSQKNEKHLKFLAKVAYELMQADLARELNLVYQPIVSWNTGEVRIVGYEALARWESQTLGKVSPDVFIGQAERCFLMAKISKILFEKALQQLANLPSSIGLSFNLSVHDVVSEQFIDYAIQMIRIHCIDPKRISMEITETSLVNDFHLADMNLRKLRKFGLKVALDDFGTGYSSLSYVHQLPLDSIKIDKTFVSSLFAHENSAAILKTLVDLARNLKIDCIAEGVENQEQLNCLLDMGVNRFQGFLFGRPLPLEQFEEIDFLDPTASGFIAVDLDAMRLGVSSNN